MSKILVFGDSISWGAFDTELGGWVERLKTYFLGNYKERDISVYNLSVSSNDTRGVLEFLEQDINKINKIEFEDLTLLFSIGSNDPRYIDVEANVVVPEAEFRENIKNIIDEAKVFSTRVVFTGLTIVDDRITQPWNGNEYWSNSDIKRYDQIIEKICKDNNIDFIPLIDAIAISDLSDGLHPNSNGHEKIFERVKNYFQKFL